MAGIEGYEPAAFIDALRAYAAAPAAQRGAFANALSDAMISKRVNLAAVRQQLDEGGERELLDALDQLQDIIEPYLLEEGVDE